jgi:hypothetical protein
MTSSDSVIESNPAVGGPSVTSYDISTLFIIISIK